MHTRRYKLAVSYQEVHSPDSELLTLYPFIALCRVFWERDKRVCPQMTQIDTDENRPFAKEYSDKMYRMNMIKAEFRPAASGSGEVGYGPVCIPTADRGNEKKGVPQERRRGAPKSVALRNESYLLRY